MERCFGNFLGSCGGRMWHEHAHGRTWKRGSVVLLATLISAYMLLASSLNAQTIEDTPVLNPANPAAGETVYVELRGNPCVLYFTAPDTPVVITRNGNAITLMVQAYVSTDPILCNFPNATYPFSIGAYGLGSYTVQVDAQYDQFFGGTITQTLDILAFNVIAAKAVPTLSDLGLMLLAFALVAAVKLSQKRAASAKEFGGQGPLRQDAAQTGPLWRGERAEEKSAGGCTRCAPVR